MFTGIVEEVGTVRRVAVGSAGVRLWVGCSEILNGVKPGDSISVNGVCLTAAETNTDFFTADVSPETLTRSNLGGLDNGSPVNLERALAAGGRLGGHILQGHVDGVGELLSIEFLGGGNWWLEVSLPPELTRYVVFKGSIGIDGISLTVAAIHENVVSVAVIPHTYRNTNLRSRQPGAKLNIECDILAKYVEKMLSAYRQSEDKLTIEKLLNLGY